MNEWAGRKAQPWTKSYYVASGGDSVIKGKWNIINFPFLGNTSIPIQSVRVTAKNHGKCPNWHLAEGSDTWLFVDEISYR